MSGSLPRIGFVGAGRLAQTLAPALAQAGYGVLAIASRTSASAEALAKLIPDCQVLASAQAVAEAVDLTFLTVPDDSIEPLAATVSWGPDMAAVHCSGAVGVEALATAADRGADVGGFHPLQAFATPDTELRGSTVAIEASGKLLAELQTMALALGCEPLRLPPGARPLYHASGAFAHNYIVTLFGQAVRLWGLLGFSETQALRALLPLAKTSLVNIERLGVARALTGPILRGDSGTVRRHLQALEGSAPDLLPMYRELGRKSVELSALEPGIAAELEAILSNPKESRPCV